MSQWGDDNKSLCEGVYLSVNGVMTSLSLRVPTCQSVG